MRGLFGEVLVAILNIPMRDLLAKVTAFCSKREHLINFTILLIRRYAASPAITSDTKTMCDPSTLTTPAYRWESAKLTSTTAVTS